MHVYDAGMPAGSQEAHLSEHIAELTVLRTQLRLDRKPKVGVFVHYIRLVVLSYNERKHDREYYGG